MKKSLVFVLAAVLVGAGVIVLSGCAAREASTAWTLSSADLASVKDLAKRFVDSINRKDVEGTMACIWDSPDMIWVNFGTVERGSAAFRKGLEGMFSQNETVKIAVTDISYVPVGDMVMAVGTATIDLQPKGGGQAVHVVERWSDLERKINGRWVYLLDHTTPVAK